MLCYCILITAVFMGTENCQMEDCHPENFYQENLIQRWCRCSTLLEYNILLIAIPSFTYHYDTKYFALLFSIKRKTIQ